MRATFERWVGGREIKAWGTNAGADVVPFQSWRNFKEAFAPEIVQRAVSESEIKVKSCLDPFAGSGTTILACQFLGIMPSAIEVNPYLADLIEAKACQYEVSSIARDFSALVRAANASRILPETLFREGPPTLVEPGLNERWIFDYEVARRLAAYRQALRKIQNSKNRRLFMVLLGGVLIDISNVVISGKGRRYRKNWERQPAKGALDLDNALSEAVCSAIDDIVAHSGRAEKRYRILRGDSRQRVREIESTDLAVFSPPYPNSFDYTDVYNVELWALGYLGSSKDNHKLRHRTLSSHVQIKRKFASAPHHSDTLNDTLSRLIAKRSSLWDNSIPEMISGYFADMFCLTEELLKKITRGGQAWIVIGDSQYAGIRVPVAQIMMELLDKKNCSLVLSEPFRSMRVAPQQGGNPALSETLLVFQRH